MKTITAAARDLVLTAIDLTRSCGANQLYFDWLALHSTALGGSAGIADYLAATALAFEDQARHYGPAAFDVFIARETLSDILMASTPLSAEELQKAVKTVIAEAREEAEAPCGHAVQTRLGALSHCGREEGV